ncbi:MAG: hypothetical protein HKN91_10910 [Acidimicrobiia bacterium]|nr:hypothetical protein [Acidimicrobiia bacterium]
MPIAIGVLIHLFLDAMWADPESLWWPLLGFEFSPTDAATAGVYVKGVLANWWVWLGEAAGLIYLVGLGRRSDLGSSEARNEFFTTGRVSAPIGLSGQPPAP